MILVSSFTTPCIRKLPSRILHLPAHAHFPNRTSSPNHAPNPSPHPHHPPSGPFVAITPVLVRPIGHQCTFTKIPFTNYGDHAIAPAIPLRRFPLQATELTSTQMSEHRLSAATLRETGGVLVTQFNEYQYPNSPGFYQRSSCPSFSSSFSFPAPPPPPPPTSSILLLCFLLLLLLWAIQVFQ
jgi:hypothetical protein